MDKDIIADESYSIEVVGFIVEKEEYGIDILVIKEIKNLPDLTKVPNMPDYVEGIVELRGEVIPIINLRKRLNLPLTDLTKDNKVIIVEKNEKVVGLIVDKVTKTKKINSSTIEPPPKMSLTANSNYILGVSRQDDKLLILLDLDEVIKDDKEEKNDNDKKEVVSKIQEDVVNEKRINEQKELERLLSEKITSLETYLKESMNTLKAVKPAVEQSAAFVPEAKGQLDKVTKATELATNEMLDLLDQVLVAQDEMMELVEEKVSKIDKLGEFFDKMDLLNEKYTGLKEKIENKGKKAEIKSAFDEFSKLWEESTTGISKELYDDLQVLKTKINEFIADAQAKAYDIMNSLQFQDITTQQIQHANKILEDTQTELTKIIELFNMYKITTNQELEAVKKRVEEKIAYDPGAVFLRDEDRQKKIDELIAKQKNFIK